MECVIAGGRELYFSAIAGYQMLISTICMRQSPSLERNSLSSG